MVEILVCADGEIVEGGVRIIETGSDEIAVIRHQGRYYAYRNLCPHQGGPVCEGLRLPQLVDVVGPDRTLVGQRTDEDDIHIVCPWHAYEFHLESGVNVCNPHLRLQKFAVTERERRVYVTL